MKIHINLILIPSLLILQGCFSKQFENFTENLAKNPYVESKIESFNSWTNEL